ncbi:MAG: restriction endonuclease [Dokdonella sp.]
MNGLKNVTSRRDDALSRVAWDQLEALLVAHYRGHQVEHVGTGGTHARFDGGIDLKLRKDDEFILVQCKHWNAKQVQHNGVQQLIDIMVNEDATGAILVTSGEFTRYAIKSATKQGHVQLIDGDPLQAMIGPLPDSHTQQALPSRWTRAVDEVRPRREIPRGRGRGGHSVGSVVTGVVVALAFVFSIAFVISHVFQRMNKTLALAAPPATAMRTTSLLPYQPLALPEPSSSPPPRASSSKSVSSVELPPPMTDATQNEWERRNATSMKILEKTTPEAK